MAVPLTLPRCFGCFHPEEEHHPTMGWCTHRVGDAQCVCGQFILPLD